MAGRIGINGFGRIGRMVLRRTLEMSDAQVVAINDLVPISELAYLLKYDSVHGFLREDVSHDEQTIHVAGRDVRFFQEREPAKIPWGSVGADIVIESTGAFRGREAAAQHLQGGARKVIISAPSSDPDATLVLGVNDDTYDPAKHDVISMASCTTNSLAPVAKVLQEQFGIAHLFITTVHAYTASQSIMDKPTRHRRRGRAGALSMIPTTTGAARATALVLPQLAGKLDGMAIRVPVPDGSVTDIVANLEKATSAEEINTRIRAALPTIYYALKHGASVVLASHLGRPKGQVDTRFSLSPVAARLEALLGRFVPLAPDCVGRQVEQLAHDLDAGEVLLLENLRFHAEEEKNDPAFAQALARLGDVYVNDAFGAAHRAHASTAGIATYCQSAVAGLLLEREITYLSKVTEHPEPPFVTILGGAKVSDKMPLITHLLNKVSTLVIGGGMAYTLLKAQGYAIGNSLVEAERIEMACDLLAKAERQCVQIILPSDHVIATKMAADAPTQVVGTEGIPDGWMGLDVGPQSLGRFAEVIASARTVFWNGPMGVFELEPFRQGTLKVAEAVAACPGTTIVGGGDTVAALELTDCREKITHVSTGGGASLEFLEGKDLPGIACLNERTPER